MFSFLRRLCGKRNVSNKSHNIRKVHNHGTTSYSGKKIVKKDSGSSKSIVGKTMALFHSDKQESMVSKVKVYIRNLKGDRWIHGKTFDVDNTDCLTKIQQCFLIRIEKFESEKRCWILRMGIEI